MKNRRAFSDIFIVIIILFLAIASIVSYKRITNQNVASNLVTHTNLVRYRLGQILNIIRRSFQFVFAQ